ncbi:hypothetical protein GX586_04790 [bacterium]|nr:hypothetical protein [bacterium]
MKAALSHAWSVLAVFCVVLAPCAHAGPGVTNYVSLTGSHTAPFDTWAKAANDIQSAVDAAGSNGFVLVTNGIYNTGGGTLFDYSGFSNRVQVFSGTQVKSVNGRLVTVIMGMPDPVTGGHGYRAMRCVYLGSGAKLSGFTLSNGYTAASNNDLADGAGAYIFMNGELSDCNIYHCRAARNGGALALDRGGAFHDGAFLYNWSGKAGGGAYITNAGVVYSAGIYYNVSSNGGGVFLANGGVVSNSYLSGNTAGYVGGGADLSLGGVVARSRLLDNNAIYGAGMYMVDGRVENSLFTGNQASLIGGGIYGNGNALIRDCTVVDNSGGSFAGGVRLQDSATMVNTIIYLNTSPASTNVLGDSDNKLVFCCTHPAVPAYLNGGGNITNYPMFVNAAGSDYHLVGASPCVDSGTNQAWMAGACDLDGNPRIYDGVVDMGAYEFVPEPAALMAVAMALLCAGRRMRG